MTVLGDYRHSFANLAIERVDGILVVRMHSDDAPLKWGIDAGAVHAQLGEAFYLIGRDPENLVVILTGTGDAYCLERDTEQYRDIAGADNSYRLEREGVDLLENLLNIEIPVISAINGPVAVHPELAILADIVLATPDTSFTDSHLLADTVPGDGGHIVWSAVLGPTRAAYFLITSETLSVDDALRMGAVHEIVERDALLDRARWHAAQLASKSPLILRYSRVALTQQLRMRFAAEMRLGLVSEMLGRNARPE